MAKFLKAKSNGTVINFDAALLKGGKYDVVEIGADPEPASAQPAVVPEPADAPEPAKARGRRKANHNPEQE